MSLRIAASSVEPCTCMERELTTRYSARAIASLKRPPRAHSRAISLRPRLLRSGASIPGRPLQPRSRKRFTPSARSASARSLAKLSARIAGAHRRQSRRMHMVMDELAHDRARSCRLPQLLERTLSRRLVRPPPHQLRAVTEAIAGDVIIAD